MFDKAVVRLAKFGIMLAWIIIIITGALIFGVLALVILFKFVGRPLIDQRELTFWLVALAAALAMNGGMLLTMRLTNQSLENVLWRTERWGKKRALQRKPHLYSCYNNGVLVVVRKSDYERATEIAEGGNDLLVVSPTFTFANFPVYSPLKEKITGSMDSFRQLTRGAHVVELMPTAVFVPYTSGMMKKADEARLYPHIPLAKAEEMIWTGYKRPKVEMI